MEGQLNRRGSGGNEEGEVSHGSQTNVGDIEDDTSTTSLEQQDENQDQITKTHTSMTPQEKALWAMSFEELYQLTRKNFRSAKTGRVKMIKWLCAKEGITPYVAAPAISPITPSPPLVSIASIPGEAIPHPEAILLTSDPALQVQINSAMEDYLNWVYEDLLALAMQRSYQIFKDSKGKMPSRAKLALAKWCAAWDILKNDREKNWWLDDGIALVNKAKAMGYQGPSKGSAKKYDVILWLRTTSEESEIEVAPNVAEPTPNKRAVKRKMDEADKHISKRRAKGTSGVIRIYKPSR